MKNNKLFLLLCLVCSFMQSANAQEVIVVDNQNDLYSVIDYYSTVEVTLTNQIELSNVLSIGDGKNIILDLNGKTLDTGNHQSNDQPLCLSA